MHDKIRNSYITLPLFFALLFICLISFFLLNLSKEEKKIVSPEFSVSSINDFNSLKKTNEISYLMDNYDEYLYNYSDVIRVPDGYIVAHNQLEEDVVYTYILKKDFSGNDIWSYKYENLDTYRYNMVLLNDKIYIAANDYGVLVLNASDGSLYKYDDDFYAFDVQVYNNNLIFVAYDKIAIVDNELTVLDSYDSSSLSTDEYNIYFEDFYIENNNVYILSTKEKVADGSCSSLIYTLDLEFNYISELVITYDENQGYLSEKGYYYDYLNFIKENDSFYQIGRDFHKIDASGLDTVIVDYNLFENNQYNGVVDVLEFEDFFVTLDVKYYYDSFGSWNDVHVFLSVRDKEFNMIKQYKVNDNFIQCFAIPESMTYMDGRIVVKWFDWATYEIYVSEFEFTNDGDMCTVIKGTGKDIGDEIKCGEEEFYVIENDGVNVKMMGKYNLLVGENYEKFLLDENYVTNDYDDMYAYLYSLPSLKEKLINGYVLKNVYYDYDSETTTYTVYGAFIYKSTQYKTGTVYCNKETGCTEDELMILARDQGYFDDNTTYYFDYYGVENGYSIMCFDYVDDNSYYDGIAYVLFDEPVLTRQEALMDSEVLEYLKMGYSFEYMNLSDGSILGVELYKTGDYTYVFVDEPIEDVRSLLKTTEVQKYLNSGYKFVSLIDESNETGYFGVCLQYSSKYLTNVILEGTYSNYQEVFSSSELAPYYDSGYDLNGTQKIDNDFIIAEMYKYDNRTYKTIVFDKVSITELDLYNREDVQTLIEQGYIVDQFVTSSFGYTCSRNSFCKYDYYGIVLVKYYNYDYVTVLFDEAIATLTEVKNHEMVLEKINDGYTFDEGLNSYYYTYITNEDGTVTNSTKYQYYGAVLYKKTGEDVDTGDDYTPYIMEKLHPMEIRQDESAIGAYGGQSGNPAPNENGVVRALDIWGYPVTDVYDSGYVDYEYYPYGQAYSYYHSYYSTLKNDGFNVIDVNSITVSEINELVYDITGNKLPLEEWYNTAHEEGYDYVTESGFYILGSIKEHVPEEYNWLWSTTYWTRTYDDSGYAYMYFVDTLGDLCLANYCQGAVGAGLRPIVTMSLSSIEFNVTTATDGNGEVVVSHETATSGDTITFDIIPNEGYVLNKVTVKDEFGNAIVYTDYKFTMPAADVEIYAAFDKIVYFEPQIEINPSLKENISIGDTIYYEIVVRNPYSFDLTDVLVKVDTLGAECEESNCTKIDDYTFKFSSIRENYRGYLSLEYVPLEFGSIEINAEILEAYAESPNFLNTEKDYIATAVATTKAGLEVCNVLTGTGNGSINQYHLVGYEGINIKFEHWIVLNDNSCTKLSIPTGYIYKITQLDKKEYTFDSVNGHITSNGESFTVEPDTYKITFNNSYEKKSYFHSWARKENDIEIFSKPS